MRDHPDDQAYSIIRDAIEEAIDVEGLDSATRGFLAGIHADFCELLGESAGQVSPAKLRIKVGQHNRIRMMRKTAGLKRAQLAADVGVPPARLKRWEYGGGTITSEEALRVASKFAVSVPFILGTEA